MGNYIAIGLTGGNTHLAANAIVNQVFGWRLVIYSTGGRTTLLGINKRGNKKIRALLVQCARVFIQKLEHQSGKLADWVRELLCRKSNFVVTCALANKLARIVWTLTARQQTY
ncbi:transposase [Hafnia psychrotolerans]|uniref:transposase n=1 Tax=Hafnia psychrotolerans TaxID=1477018 RepID=UPI00227BE314|nr:transposase [Hafnia psychrotolerans]